MTCARFSLAYAADIMYAMCYPGLKQTGPMVIASPPNTIAMITDFKQRTLTDIERAVPDRDVFLILRLYGSDIEFFDRTWRPDDLVKLD